MKEQGYKRAFCPLYTLGMQVHVSIRVARKIVLQLSRTNITVFASPFVSVRGGEEGRHDGRSRLARDPGGRGHSTRL